MVSRPLHEIKEFLYYCHHLANSIWSYLIPIAQYNWHVFKEAVGTLWHTLGFGSQMLFIYELMAKFQESKLPQGAVVINHTVLPSYKPPTTSKFRQSSNPRDLLPAPLPLLHKVLPPPATPGGVPLAEILPPSAYPGAGLLVSCSSSV